MPKIVYEKNNRDYYNGFPDNGYLRRSNRNACGKRIPSRRHRFMVRRRIRRKADGIRRAF
jgi:hypothetical protein